jgi:hypothetical protein
MLRGLSLTLALTQQSLSLRSVAALWRPLAQKSFLV